MCHVYIYGAHLYCAILLGKRAVCGFSTKRCNMCVQKQKGFGCFSCFSATDVFWVPAYEACGIVTVNHKPVSYHFFLFLCHWSSSTPMKCQLDAASLREEVRSSALPLPVTDFKINSHKEHRVQLF